MDKRKVAIIGHEVGAIAALHKGLSLQAARLQARDAAQPHNGTETHTSPADVDPSAGNAEGGASEASEEAAAAGAAASGSEARSEEDSGRGRKSELRVSSIVMLDPSILPGLDRPPVPILMPGGEPSREDVEDIFGDVASKAEGGNVCDVGWGSLSKNVSEACEDVMRAM